MPEDASLDAFAAAGEDGAETESDESGAEPEADAGAPEAEPSARPTADDDALDPDPATSTYAWSPDGGECAACGASVERRWRDGDDLVCPDCKEW